ncbi:unnamed protein product [Linum trigynum]|uniref:Reverse transcriptase n=1 Tax=Linum trigynum TaxID=586398 RepID=A0AAV2FF74_9ROSI
MRLNLEPIDPFRVRIANGERLCCRAKCPKVHVMIQGAELEVSLFVLPIRRLDVVLGVQWLEELGSVICYWKTLTMKFKWRDKEYCLQGVSSGMRRANLDELCMEEGVMWAICLPLQAAEIEPLPPDLQELVREFETVFEKPEALPPHRPEDHHIKLKEGADAVNVRPYRYGYHQKGEIEKQVQEMMQVGLIRPSSSPFSSPVLLVKKKDGTWRFCTDYRALNEATIKDRYPIPTIEDMLDELHGAKYFTRLDLRAGYHQIRMAEEDVRKTAFRTHNGHYEYLAMPFGLCNAPSTFQAAMNDLFRDILRRYVLVYFYDILIHSKTWDDHLQHVRHVLEALRRNQYYVKFSKCAFGLRELEYLGHIISDTRVKADPNKIQAMTNWPRPTSVTEMRGFLGLTGYYRKFIRNYGAIAKSLTDLLKKGASGWSDSAETAFTDLKRAMASAPTLAMPNFQLPFVIEADASGKGIGAVLAQEGRPIAFMSKVLGPAKAAWSTYQKEMLAITTAVQMWRPYLLGQKFHIYTDQKSLKYILEQRIVTPDQHKWVSKLLGFDYSIHYKTGSSNRVADALSRLPNGPWLDAITRPQSSFWDELRAAMENNPYLQEVRERALAPEVDHYAYRQGLVFYKGRIVLPPLSSLVTTVLKEFHDSPMGGHSGAQRTLSRISRHFYWPQMGRTVRDYVSSCDTCQRVKSDSLSPAGLLQPLPIPCQVWEDISMDFVEGLPSSGGRSVLFVVVDRLTKYAHFMSLSHPYTARKVVDEFIHGVVRHHGIPSSIVSDRDAVFLSHFWQEFFGRTGTRINMSSAYHPQSDGQMEVINRCLEQYLRCFAHQQPRKWHMFLPWAKLWYNTSYHRTIGMTPFKALYGRDPPNIIPYAGGTSSVAAVDVLLGERDGILRELKATLVAANEYMKQRADLKRRELHFEVGDLVLLRLQPYRQSSAFRRASQKLAARYFGPYAVAAKVGEVAYRLQFPEDVRIHPVFHVSLLKPYRGTPPEVPAAVPPVSDDGDVMVEPEQILDYRWVHRSGKMIEEGLVRWAHLLIEEATWEEMAVLRDKFPDFDLGDKVTLLEGSNDEGVTQPVSRETYEPEEPRRTKRVPKPNPRYDH